MGEKKDLGVIERLLWHLFCVAVVISYIFKCMCLRLCR